MKSYCVKQKKMTDCLPGSEQYVVTSNGRNAMKCKCAECGITKFRFVKGSSGAVRRVTRTTTARRGRKKKGKGLLLGKNSPFNKIQILGQIL